MLESRSDTTVYMQTYDSSMPSGSDNGLSPVRYQVIMWTSEGLLLPVSLGTNFSEKEYATFKIVAILSRPQSVKLRCLNCSYRPRSAMCAMTKQ